jgi:hypothetical protein
MATAPIQAASIKTDNTVSYIDYVMLHIKIARVKETRAIRGHVTIGGDRISVTANMISLNSEKSNVFCPHPVD